MSNTVYDTNGGAYELSSLLGKGGQGAVYSVKGGRLAVKIVNANNAVTRERMRNQLMQVRRLPLKDLSIAKPLEMLRPPHTGYVMELLSGMHPIKSLQKPQKGQNATAEWYVSGGGLKRRLFLLGRGAHILAQVHGRGLAYSDPSPDNVFVSSKKGRTEVWLIDADNLVYESAPAAKNGLYTPGFGAPELIAGKSGVTSLTDVYAYSILAFKTLAIVHPFIGDYVNDGEPELEEKAYQGLLPWIEDPQNRLNSASFGVPRKRVLSQRLMDMFNRTFGEGALKPEKRPSMAEVAENFFSASDAAIVCKECSASYYFTESICPWCTTVRPTIVIAKFHIWDPGYGSGGLLPKPGDKSTPRLIGQCVIQESEEAFISRRLTHGDTSVSMNEPSLKASFSGEQLSFESANGSIFTLYSPDESKKTTLSDGSKSIRLSDRSASWRIHFGGNEELHRVASFVLLHGVKS